jgi:hypothetical protein
MLPMWMGMTVQELDGMSYAEQAELQARGVFISKELIRQTMPVVGWHPLEYLLREILEWRIAFLAALFFLR